MNVVAYNHLAADCRGKGGTHEDLRQRRMSQQVTPIDGQSPLLKIIFGEHKLIDDGRRPNELITTV